MSDAPRGTLVLAGTPLGNPADASPRLAGLLASADLVVAEDTRRLRRLLADLGVERTGPVLAYYEDVERARLPRLLEVLATGGTVALVTDAGMPSVSDPGYRAARAALDAGHRVTALPGPSAVTTALAVSGLPCDRFCFEGFLPRRAAERRARLGEVADEPRTLVWFEAPHRLAASLADLAEALGADRPAAVCRELSKTYEEVRRDGLARLAAWAAADEVRGEITIVVAGAPAGGPADAVDAAGLAARVAGLEAQGVPRKEAIALVARATGTPKRSVFDAVVAAKERSG
ncbi:MAG: 16S rRNA (cytidine(1402)-2'-O)-methyltransferase [Candidatus Nanopelagicales bacterium]|jgi:16S rRNA (cytidine1402-2'-O)-methyltransferase|nr:16S rRNA (cytidine(1402)-2'-O)-methyltransferase [Candidatus Nanopelagicales bacterium]